MYLVLADLWFIPRSFVRSVTTRFKLSRLRANVLTVLRVVYAIVFDLAQANSLLHVDLIKHSV